MSDAPPTANVVETEREDRADTPESSPQTTPLVEADLLVEDVSIDGMCGVY